MVRQKNIYEPAGNGDSVESYGFQRMKRVSFLYQEPVIDIGEKFRRERECARTEYRSDTGIQQEHAFSSSRERDIKEPTLLLGLFGGDLSGISGMREEILLEAGDENVVEF